LPCKLLAPSCGLVYFRPMDSGRELPSYTVRESARAKRVILRVTGERGLEVVVPKGFDHDRVRGVVAGRREWVLAQLEKLRMAGHSPGTAPALPERVRLLASGEEYIVSAIVRPGAGRLDENPGHRIMLAARDAEQGAALLKSWLKKRAKAVLPGLLRQESMRVGLGFSRIQVRMQRSRWGSRSGRGTISLNARLMFLPQDVVRYVLVHELCHVRHMDHSQAFWRLVASFVPDYERMEKRLKEEPVRLVPPWAL